MGKKNIPWKEIEILIFENAGVKMGVDMAQVYQIINPMKLDKDRYKVFSIHEKIYFKQREIKHKSPKILMVKEEKHSCILIEQPDTFLTLDITFIKELPLLVVSTINSSVFWGAFFFKKQIILLVDLFELVKCKQ